MSKKISSSQSSLKSFFGKTKSTNDENSPKPNG